MQHRLKTLTRLELCNLFGINVFLHTKNKPEKRKKIALAAVAAIGLLAVIFYMGGLAYGLVSLGMQELVPVYLITLASIFILIFGIFKAGPVVFHKNGYDFISSLPVSRKDIVLGRYLRMYVEELLLTCLVWLPGIVVYGVLVKPGITFYLFGISGMFFIPMLPLSAALFLGAVVTGISSRMRHKGLAEAVLSLVLVIGITGGMSGLVGDVEGELDPERLKELSGFFYSVFEKLYRPAVWLGGSMENGTIFGWLLFVASSLFSAVAVVTIVSFCFHAICAKLFESAAKHNYQMREQERNSLRIALCRRELKRYFSSGVYVTNTIVGPVMGVILSVTLFVAGPSVVTESFPFAVDVCGAAPFLLSMAFCMMNMTCVSVSMEGKNWWILKSLPLRTNEILEAKLMASIVLLSPFYLVSEIFLLLALRPGFLDALWVIFLPVLCIVFSAAFGLAVNLKFPVLKWESEVAVVKQSASAVLGGLLLIPVFLVLTVLVAVVPAAVAWAARAAAAVLFLLITALLVRRNNRTNLLELE